MMKKISRKILSAVKISAVIVLGLGFLVGNYLYDLLLNPYIDKTAILRPSKGLTDIEHQSFGEPNPEYKQWMEENSHNEYIQSFDKLILHAYFLENQEPSNKWIIMCHGYNGNGTRLSKTASYFYDMGFNVCLPDARGLGESEGHYIGLGWDDRLDVISWIKKILDENDENTQIVLYGVSMGASTVMMTSGEDLPQNVKCVIEDCGYTSAWDEFAYQLKKYFNAPASPILNFLSIITQIRAGYSIEDASAKRQIAKSDLPILFIHGSQDDFVPTFMAEKLYLSTAAPKDKLIVEGAEHGESFEQSPEIYHKKVEEFLSLYCR